MSFIGSALKLAGRVAGAFLGIAPAAARAAPIAVTAAGLGARAARAGAGGLALARRAAPIAAAGAVFGAADIATQSLLGRDGAPLAAGGGNGRFRTATLVRTVDAVTGETVSERILSGSPFLMNRDLAIAKRVLRTAGKLGRKFSRKGREKSKRSILLDAIEDKAISQALGVDCPKPC